jgi:alpha-L-fucosidase 2
MKWQGIAMVAMVFVSCFYSQAQENIPFESALKEADITLSKMDNGQTEGLILGNGDLYGLVWIKNNQLFMRITKNDIWDARVDTSEDKELPKVNIENATFTGHYGNQPSWEHTYPQPRSATGILLGAVPSSIRAHLDTKKAVVSIYGGQEVHTTLRILHNRNVLLIKSENPVSLEEIKAETLPDAKLGSTDGVKWLLMNMPGDADYKGMDYAIAIETKGKLKAISLVTSFDIQEGDVLQKAIRLAKETLAEKEEKLIETHEQGWNSYWSRSGVKLEDKVMQRWWYRLLYFAQTVSKPGTSPVGLMPPLATDTTPWHADFHHNYNSWQAFWPLPGANHSELADPWITYVNQMLPKFKHLAKTIYGIEGAAVPISTFLHEVDPNIAKSRNKRQMTNLPWGLTIGLAGMTVQSMWQKHLRDPDAEYMESKIYPFLSETAKFYVNFMAKCKKDEQGKILLGPSYSPEHGEWGIFNCPFDIAYVHYTFDALIQAANELKRDTDLVKQCQKYKALLGDYPTTMKAGQPIVVDWKGSDGIEIHNITVPVSPVFPANQISWFSPESQKKLFKHTILNTRFNGNNSHVMFNIAKARLSMPQAITDARKWFMSRELPNGLFLWKGHQHGTYMPEMIGIVGLINEFLLQSVHNKIRLFPCWPSEQDASFNGLRAQGGFIVSANFEKGRVASATIKSTVDKQLQLLSPWKTIYANGKKISIDEAGLITLNTKEGQVFKFSETLEK